MGPLHYKVQDKEHVTAKVIYNTNIVAVIAVCTCVVRLSQYSKSYTAIENTKVSVLK